MDRTTKLLTQGIIQHPHSANNITPIMRLLTKERIMVFHFSNIWLNHSHTPESSYPEFSANSALREQRAGVFYVVVVLNVLTYCSIKLSYKIYSTLDHSTWCQK